MSVKIRYFAQNKMPIFDICLMHDLENDMGGANHNYHHSVSPLISCNNRNRYAIAQLTFWDFHGVLYIGRYCISKLINADWSCSRYRRPLNSYLAQSGCWSSHWGIQFYLHSVTRPLWELRSSTRIKNIHYIQICCLIPLTVNTISQSRIVFCPSVRRIRIEVIL